MNGYSIILPVHNQGDHLGALIDDYVAALSDLAIEPEIILVVNGKIVDDTLEVARALESKHDCVRVIHSAEGGWGHSVILGIQSAGKQYICYTNAARTNAHDLSLAIKKSLELPDKVVKFCRNDRDNIARFLGSFLYNLEGKLLFSINLKDINGTPKVFPKKFDQLLQLSRKDDLIDMEFGILCRENNYPVEEFFLSSVKRHSGKSTTSLKSAWKMYSGVWKMWLHRDQGR